VGRNSGAILDFQCQNRGVIFSMRKISASPLIVGQLLFVRAIENFRACPNEAELKSNDISQHQNRIKLLREKYEENEEASRHQRQDYSDAHALR
jgi:hypothetical protein